MDKLTSPKVRRWLYGVAIAFVPLAVHLGWMTAEGSPIVLALVMALLNVNDDDTAD